VTLRIGRSASIAARTPVEPGTPAARSMSRTTISSKPSPRATTSGPPPCSTKSTPREPRYFAASATWASALSNHAALQSSILQVTPTSPTPSGANV
jgi:hypothetical protein